MSLMVFWHLAATHCQHCGLAAAPLHSEGQYIFTADVYEGTMHLSGLSSLSNGVGALLCSPSPPYSPSNRKHASVAKS